MEGGREEEEGELHRLIEGKEVWGSNERETESEKENERGNTREKSREGK